MTEENRKDKENHYMMDNSKLKITCSAQPDVTQVNKASKRKQEF
jgi:hypothetical protein